MTESIASVLATPEDSARLRLLAVKGDEQGSQEVLQQFEALFLQQMLKSMRAASLGDGLLQSEQSEFFRDMYDQQIATDIAKNRLLGISDLLSRELGFEQDTSVNDKDNNLGFNITQIVPIENKQSQPVKSVLDGQLEPDFELISAVENDNSNLRIEYELNHPVVTTALEAEFEENSITDIPSNITQDEVVANSPQEFVDQVSQHAVPAAERLGVSTDVLIAIAALETGWGKHFPANSDASSNNYFGIKADARWEGDRLNSQTLEFEDGVFNKQNESFRVYSDLTESFNDFAEFLLKNDRYSNALEVAGDAAKFLQEIQKAGYATDPNYADKVLNVLNNKAFSNFNQ